MWKTKKLQILLGETSKFPFCDHKQTTKDDKRRRLSLCDPDLSVASSRGYVTSHICWLGLKFVTSQRTFFCFVGGLYVGILTSSLTRMSTFAGFTPGLTLQLVYTSTGTVDFSLKGTECMQSLDNAPFFS